MKEGFNSSFVEIRTIEGDKFIKDLRIGDLILTHEKEYVRLEEICERKSQLMERVFNIYFHGKEEGILSRISGESQLINFKKIKDLQKGDFLQHNDGIVVVDEIEELETVNRFFYNLKLKNGTSFFADNICIKSMN